MCAHIRRTVEVPAQVAAAASAAGGGPLRPEDVAWPTREAAMDVAGRLAGPARLVGAYRDYVRQVLGPVTGDVAALAAAGADVAAAVIIEPVRGRPGGPAGERLRKTAGGL